MSAITLCPSCNTRFKVTQTQIDAHQGLVRCGRCQTVFNATEYFQLDPALASDDVTHSATAPLPIAQDKQSELTTIEEKLPVEPHTEEENKSLIEEFDREFSVQSQLDQPVAFHPLKLVPHTSAKITVESASNVATPDPILTFGEKPNFTLLKTEPQISEHHVDEPLQAESPEITNPTEPIIVTKDSSVDKNPKASNLKHVKNKHTGLWAVGCLLLVMILLAQAVYYFRIDLAATQPDLKPALVSYCKLLQCTVPLPRKEDLMSIESSELETIPAQASFITLNALLRNHAPYSQAYPNLELTLTDTQDKSLARRTFRPSEYLKPNDNEKQGLASNHELSVKLNLDTTDLKPSGFRLLLFYPQNRS